MRNSTKPQSLMLLSGMRVAILIAMLVFGVGQIKASVIGNWDSSNRTWNHSNFSTVKASVVGAGHTVEPDGPISAANLAGDDVFIIGEASISPSGPELSDLSSWVNGGGILLVLSDSGGDGVPAGNAIFAGIGSTMSFTGSFSNGPLSGGVLASDGPPFNIVGQILQVSSGNGVVGGNALASTYIRYEAIGNGFVFAFGDRPDHNYFSPSSANTNGKLFLNLAATPEPGTIILLGLSGLAMLRRR